MSTTYSDLGSKVYPDTAQSVAFSDIKGKLQLVESNGKTEGEQEFRQGWTNVMKSGKGS